MKKHSLILSNLSILLLCSCGTSGNSSAAVTSSVSSNMTASSASTSVVISSSSSSNVTTSQVAPGEFVSFTSDLLPATAQSKYLADTEITIGKTKFMVNQIEQGTGENAGHIQAAKGKESETDTTITADPGSIYNETEMSGLLTLFILDKTNQWNTVKAIPTVYTGSAMNPSEEEATATTEAMTIDGKKYDVYTYTIVKGYFAYWDYSARAAYIKELRISC